MGVFTELFWLLDRYLGIGWAVIMMAGLALSMVAGSEVLRAIDQREQRRQAEARKQMFIAAMRAQGYHVVEVRRDR